MSAHSHWEGELGIRIVGESHIVKSLEPMTGQTVIPSKYRCNMRGRSQANDVIQFRVSYSCAVQYVWGTCIQKPRQGEV